MTIPIIYWAIIPYNQNRYCPARAKAEVSKTKKTTIIGRWPIRKCLRWMNEWIDGWMHEWASLFCWATSLLSDLFSQLLLLRIAFYHLLSGLLLLWPASASFSVASATQFFSSRSHAANGSDSSRCSEHVSFLRFFLWTWALVRISQTSSSKSFTPLQRETFF